MRKRSINAKSANSANLTSIIAKAAEVVTVAVQKVVTDPEPAEGVPPADFVAETPPPAAARAEPAPAAEIPPVGIARGRGGTKGGAARTGKLTPERRREIARKAAEARWKKARTK